MIEPTKRGRQSDAPGHGAMSMDGHNTGVLTIQQLEELKRGNLVAALQAGRWRVSGETGAARLLGMNPSTLTSRMKVLGISRPVQT